MQTSPTASSHAVDGVYFHFADEATARELAPFLKAIASSPETLPGFEMKRKGRIRRAALFRFETGTRVVYCKTVRPKNLIAYVKDLFRLSRAANFWVQSRRIQQLGFPVLPMLAYAERKVGPFVREGLLLTEEVTNATPLYEHLKQRLCHEEAFQARWRFMRELGSFVGRMHQEGIVHGDLRPNNILVRETPEGHQFLLIDNDRTDILPRPARRVLLRNLQQINMVFLPRTTMSDRLRFFRAYHEGLGLPVESEREHRIEAIASCEKRLRRYIEESEDELTSVSPSGSYRDMIRAITRIRSASLQAESKFT